MHTYIKPICQHRINYSKEAAQSVNHFNSGHLSITISEIQMVGTPAEWSHLTQGCGNISVPDELHPALEYNKYMGRYQNLKWPWSLISDTQCWAFQSLTSLESQLAISEPISALISHMFDPKDKYGIIHQPTESDRFHLGKMRPTMS